MHHFNIDKVTYRLLKKEQTKIDKAMLFAGISIQLATLFQAVEIFTNKNSGSVSLISWVFYASFSVVALMYATVHKLRPMIITNSLGLVVNGLVVAGCLIY
jgi:uncharacterized protein with PQ loop repeat